MKPHAQSPSRIDAIVHRQRAGRTRDVVFTVLLVIGIGMSIGALGNAGAPPSSLAAAPSTSHAAS